VLLRALDQELAPRQQWMVKLHLDHCEPCRVRLEQMQQVTSQIREFHEALEHVPLDSPQGFLARLEREEASDQPGTPHARWFHALAPRWRLLAWAAALALLILAAVKWRTPQQPAMVSRRSAEHVAAPPSLPLVARETPEKPARHARRFVKRHALPAVKEVATQFFPLPFSDQALPLEQASVIRVDLPRSALELTGLPVEESRRNERIRADLVLGADGLARAIRFIR
jgi:hypothetical protein